MAGLYIHIPFCKSRCIYCGFYSTTQKELQERYVNCLTKLIPNSLTQKSLTPNSLTPNSLTPNPSPNGEGSSYNGSAEANSSFFILNSSFPPLHSSFPPLHSSFPDSHSSFFTLHSSFKIETIYFGGGTPSQLTEDQLQRLFLYINKVYGMDHVKEVTMECNPDDITVAYAEMLSQLPINRISMGVQTFSNDRLRFLHRRHTAEQIPLAVERLRNIGIRNISIDLMYGFPDETLADWHRDIDEALRLNVEHLSAYGLMYEEGTPLYRLLEQGKVSEIDEELSLQMYSDLIDRLTEAGYEHYEISNFAKWMTPDATTNAECPPTEMPSPRKSFRSLHNSNYWNQTPYIGLGAAAHSYDGHNVRRWNVDNVLQFIEGVEKGLSVYEEEMIDDDTRYNDIVMTALRTCEGLQLSLLSPDQQTFCLNEAKRFLADGLLERTPLGLRLTRRGLFVSNMVMSGLMKV